MKSRSTSLKHKEIVREQLTRVTRKGQVTIPVEIRNKLDLNEGDAVAWRLEKQQVSLKRSSGIVARTAGVLKGGGKALTAEEERAAVEQAVAEEVAQRSYR